MTPIESAIQRLKVATAVADERDRCYVQSNDISRILREICRLQNLEVQVVKEKNRLIDRIHPEIGCCVIYVNPQGAQHMALVLAVWGSRDDICQPALNLCYTSVDESHKGIFGRSIMYATNIVHQSMQSSPGNFWL